MKRLIIICITMLLLVGCTGDKKVGTKNASINNKEIVYQGVYESSYDTKVDPMSLYNYVTDCFVAKVVSIKETEVNEIGGITTPIEVEIISSKKGTLTKNIVLHQTGGLATVYKFKKHAPKELSSKMKLDKVEKTKEKKVYVKEVPVEYVELTVGEEYLFFVNQDDLGNHIVCNGYGSLKKDNKSFKNVYTNEIYDEDIFNK